MKGKDLLSLTLKRHHCHPTTFTYLLLLSEDSSSAESLLLPLELPVDSWPWLSLPCDSDPLPLDPLLFISTSSSVGERERWFWGDAGGSCPLLLSLPSDWRPRSGPPWLKRPMRCSCAMEPHLDAPRGSEPHWADAPHPEASPSSRIVKRYCLESEFSDMRRCAALLVPGELIRWNDTINPLSQEAD